MVKITHYEVYTDKGDGWKLEDRFSSEQREGAINLAKEFESNKTKVKIIREIFDVQDNSYQETVEYVSVFNKPKPESSPLKISVYDADKDEVEPQKTEEVDSSAVFKAILKVVSIIALSLVFANLLASLLLPIVEDLAAEENVQPIVFILFFVIFMSLAIPLLLNKVPWYIFTQRPSAMEEAPKQQESRYYEKAETIERLYRLNEGEPSVAPAWPEAPLEYKHYIVDFLRRTMDELDSGSMFEDSFSKLGVKFIVFGGCMELSRHSGLKFTQANSLLFESFKILDGDDADLEGFYESKKTYGDNKIAMFLTGLGAQLMAKIIAEQPVDFSVVKLSFKKWEDQLNGDFQKSETKPLQNKISEDLPCIVNVSYQFRFYDGMTNDEKSEEYNTDMQNIIYNLLNKYRPVTHTDKKKYFSIEYLNAESAAKFAIDFLRDVTQYKEDISDENLLFLSKCNLIDIDSEIEDNENYIEDILDHTFNNEIIVTEKIKDNLYSNKYEFEYLGEKRLNKTERLVALYKLIY